MKLMKYKEAIHIGLMTLLLLWVAGCNIREDDLLSCNLVNMEVGITTRGATSDTDILSKNLNEYRIRKIRIFVFNSDGSWDATFFDGNVPANSESYKSPYFRVSKSDNKTVCAVLNEPDAAAAALDAVRSHAELEAVTYKMADYINEENLLLRSHADTYCLPMYGEVGGVNVPAQYNDINNLEVNRCVARVDVYMATKDNSNISIPSTATLQASNTGKHGYLTTRNQFAINETTGEMQIVGTDTSLDYVYPASSDDPGRDFEDTDKYFSFYLPEKKVTVGNELTLHIKGISIDDLGTTKDYTVKVNPQNAGKDMMERNKVYQLYLTLRETDYIDIEVHVTPWELAGTQTVEETADVRMTNCHIVAPGGRVHIPLSEVYKIWRDVFGEEIDQTATVTAEVLWQNGTTNDILPASNVTVVRGSGATHSTDYIKVVTGTTEGNAVVAMKVNGEVKWSWHIWNTTYEPNVTEGQTNVNGRIWMTCDLGRTQNFWLNYQYGRKDPLIDNYINSETIPATATYWENAIMSVKNPTTYYTNWWNFWNAAPGRNYWINADQSKGIFDPCPDGWRITQRVSTRLVSMDYTPLRCVKDE